MMNAVEDEDERERERWGDATQRGGTNVRVILAHVPLLLPPCRLAHLGWCCIAIELTIKHLPASAMIPRSKR